MTIFKVDLSNHDWGRGSVDIAAMRRDGIDVVIHKATDGPRFYRDPYFAEAMRRARAADMPITGAYHVLWNGNVTAQVDWFIDTVLAAAPWAATEPFEWMWDCEPFGYNGSTPTVATINAACDRFMQRLPNHRPLAYCPKWAYGSLTGMNCPVVASSYGTNPAAPYRQAYPGDGSGRWAAYGGVDAPVILQFGSNATVGSQRTVDANAYRGTIDQLRALITGGDMTALQATPDGYAPYSPDTARAIAIGATSAGFVAGTAPGWDDEAGKYNLKAIYELIGTLQVAGQPTQDQVNAAVAAALPAALTNPEVAKALGAGFLAALRGN